MDSDAGTKDANAKEDANSGGQQGDGKGGEQKIEFSAEQQKVIDALVGEARKKARKQAEDEARTDREAADKKAKEEAAVEAGEFEGIAQVREQERDAARKEAASLQAKVDQLQAAIDNAIATEWKALPSEVLDAYIGDDEDALGKLAFLPKGKALAAKLEEKAESIRGNGHDPKSRGDGRTKPLDEAARTANASRYG